MASKLDKLASRQRPGGNNPTQVSREIQELPGLQHYQWSELMYMQLDFFKDNPANKVFAEIKNTDENQIRYKTLKDDIRAVGIHEPILATQNGLILSGHSRVQIARELAQEGNPLGKIPVILLESKISSDEMDRIIVSCNVNRFQTDINTRLLQMAKIAPNYFNDKSTGGRVAAEVSQEKAYLQDQFSLKETNIKKEKKVFQIALDIAFQNGKNTIGVEEIEEARKMLLEKRYNAESGKNTLNLDEDKKTSLDIINEILTEIKSNYKGKEIHDDVVVGIQKFIFLAVERKLIKNVDVTKLEF